MIKVCHMTSAHNSQDVRILKKQCTSLAKKYETYLVAKGESYIENDVNVIGIGEISGGRLKRMTQTAKEIYKKALELDCDIYQIHDPELLFYAKKMKRKGKKVIFDSHEDYTLQIKEKKYIPRLLRRTIAYLFSRYQESVLRKIDGAIFPCLKDEKHIFDGKCKHITTVGNEPKLEELYDMFNPNSIKLPRSICHVGALTYDRGIEHFIKAGDKANAEIILGGSFNTLDFEEKIFNSAEFKSVDYRGFCDRGQVRKIYEESLVGNCTLLNIGQYNTYDNFATKIYEYMAMGLPVIMSNYEFARKVNDEYDFAILVEPENIEEVAKAITYLLKNPLIGKKMGQNGRRAIKEKFNWNIEEKKLLALYGILEKECEKGGKNED